MVKQLLTPEAYQLAHLMGEQFGEKLTRQQQNKRKQACLNILVLYGVELFLKSQGFTSDFFDNLDFYLYIHRLNTGVIYLKIENLGKIGIILVNPEETPFAIPSEIGSNSITCLFVSISKDLSHIILHNFTSAFNAQF